MKNFLSLSSKQPPHFHYSTSGDIPVVEDSLNMLLSMHTTVQTDSLLLYLQNQISLVHLLRLHCLFRRKHCSAPCRPLASTNTGDYLIHPLPILQVPIPPGSVVTLPIQGQPLSCLYLPSPAKFQKKQSMHVSTSSFIPSLPLKVEDGSKGTARQRGKIQARLTGQPPKHD